MLLLFLLLAVRTAFWVRGGVVGDISGSGKSSLCISLDCTEARPLLCQQLDLRIQFPGGRGVKSGERKIATAIQCKQLIVPSEALSLASLSAKEEEHKPEDSAPRQVAHCLCMCNHLPLGPQICGSMIFPLPVFAATKIAEKVAGVWGLCHQH